jgi:predicted anti-sigma-YlaC factor YlaD
MSVPGGGRPPLTCAQVRERLTEYAEGTLPLVEGIALCGHLLECPPCRRLHQRMRALAGLAGLLLGPGPALPPRAARMALEEALRRIGGHP